MIQREFRLEHVPLDQMLPRLLELLKDEPCLPILLNMCLDRVLPPGLTRPDFVQVPPDERTPIFWELVKRIRRHNQA